MLAAGVDTLVLGCTHYPFVLPLIRRISEEIAPGQVKKIIDPAPAVARQTGRLLAWYNLIPETVAAGNLTLFTTADRSRFVEISQQLLGYHLPAVQASWSVGKIVSA
jgi:glutamate racemase